MDNLIVIRGGGDLATGVIQKFHRCGFPVLVLEVEKPTAIRTTVALSQAIYRGSAQVEDVVVTRISSLEEMTAVHRRGQVAMLVDPNGASIQGLRPICVVDAILAKRNLGTHRGMAPVTIGLGPGLIAGEDVDVVIETVRGHDLGRLIFKGSALPNTGIPGVIGGKGAQRVIHAPEAGYVAHIHAIGDVVEEGEPILTVGGVAATAPFTGLLRGLIPQGLSVPKGMKIADIDPRVDVDWHTISDKARAIGGGALEGFFTMKHRKVEQI